MVLPLLVLKSHVDVVISTSQTRSKNQTRLFVITHKYGEQILGGCFTHFSLRQKHLFRSVTELGNYSIAQVMECIICSFNSGTHVHESDGSLTFFTKGLGRCCSEQGDALLKLPTRIELWH